MINRGYSCFKYRLTGALEIQGLLIFFNLSQWSLQKTSRNADHRALKVYCSSRHVVFHSPLVRFCWVTLYTFETLSIAASSEHVNPSTNSGYTRSESRDMHTGNLSPDSCARVIHFTGTQCVVSENICASTEHEKFILDDDAASESSGGIERSYRIPAILYTIYIFLFFF